MVDKHQQRKRERRRKKNQVARKIIDDSMILSVLGFSLLWT